MNKRTEKPSPEAKALSLFLMAFKSAKPINRENAKRINKQWDRVKLNQLSIEDYAEDVQKMLDYYGGYSKVVEETVWFYIKKTGEWKLEGDDKYCQDAKQFAEEILAKRKK